MHYIYKWTCRYKGCIGSIEYKCIDCFIISGECFMKKKTLGLVLGVCLALCSGCGDDVDASVMEEYSKIVGIPIEELERDGVNDNEIVSQNFDTDGQSTQADEGALEEDDLKPVVVEATPIEESVEESVEEPPAPKEIDITVSVTGDVTLGTHQKQGYKGSIYQVYDDQGPEYFFENVYDYFSNDDMTLVNLEGMFTESEKKNGTRTFYIKGRLDYVDALKAGDIEAVSMANNHRLDFGEVATDDTVKVLEEADVKYAYEDVVGIYETEKGIRIGYVASNVLSDGQKGAEKIFEEGINKLKEENVDLIFCCAHWGKESKYNAEKYQSTLGQKCIDWGADLVIGHHPHVLQGVEEYKGKYILYSLGNFCFGANQNPKDKDSMIFQQTFHFVDGEKQDQTEAKMIPCSISSVSNKNDFKPTPAVDKEKQRIIDKMNKMCQKTGVQFDEEGNAITEANATSNTNEVIAGNATSTGTVATEGNAANADNAATESNAANAGTITTDTQTVSSNNAQ